MFKLIMLLVNFFYYLLELVNKIYGTSKNGYMNKSVDVKSIGDLI